MPMHSRHHSPQGDYLEFPGFSEQSFGIRSGGGADVHEAQCQASSCDVRLHQGTMNEAYRW